MAGGRPLHRPFLERKVTLRSKEQSPGDTYVGARSSTITTLAAYLKLKRRMHYECC
jgi:hypothetical protein